MRTYRNEGGGVVGDEDGEAGHAVDRNMVDSFAKSFYHAGSRFVIRPVFRNRMMSVADYIPEMVARIVSAFHPLRIVLFGSHARGNADERSDIDLLVVMSEVENRRGTAIEIRRLLSTFPVCKDIIVTTPDEIRRCGGMVGTVLRPALYEGRVVYEQGASR